MFYISEKYLELSFGNADPSEEIHTILASVFWNIQKEKNSAGLFNQISISKNETADNFDINLKKRTKRGGNMLVVSFKPYFRKKKST